MASEELLESAFGSSFFPDSRWSVVEVAHDIPEVPKHSDPVAQMYADVSWFELGHLNVGETCRLSGGSNAQFWKTEEDTMLCRLDDGRVGVYKHESDMDWEDRRWRAERMAMSILKGGPLNE